MMNLPSFPCLAALPLACILLFGCSRNERDQRAKDIEAFTYAYINFQMDNAAGYCTPESRLWLSLIASNLTENDLELIRSQEEGPSVQLTDMKEGSDSTATAFLKISHAVRLDSIGRPARLVESTVIRLQLVKRGERWLVALPEK